MPLPFMAVLVVPWLALGCGAAREAGSALSRALPHEDVAAARARTQALLASASRFAIQLQGLNFDAVDRADPDVVVVDYSWDGGASREMTRADVRRLRQRPGRQQRIVLAYLSIGEAESYRWYWKREARGGKASFLIRENPRWPGNFLTRYWDPAWHEVIVTGRSSYLSRVLDAGFDGVFLDTVDTAEVLRDEGMADAPARMADLIRLIAREARAAAPGFLLVAQNPFVVIGEPGVMEVLSGVVAEAHLFRGEKPVPEHEVRPVVDALRLARDRGLAAIVIEYPRSAAARGRLSDLCARERFICYVGSRSLSRMGVPIEAVTR